HGYRVSKATIYNTLGLFARKGLVKERVVDPTKVYYDTKVTPHQHFYNEDSGELIDINQDLPPLTPSQLPEGTRIDSVDVIIRLRNN
ncbi:MAG: transcriptional repressor, partial [Gammaproteobacteria bacterium]|nr:transcriptional repressor [Gammaproteobacteria bacterium]